MLPIQESPQAYGQGGKKKKEQGFGFANCVLWAMYLTP